MLKDFKWPMYSDGFEGKSYEGVAFGIGFGKDGECETIEDAFVTRLSELIKGFDTNSGEKQKEARVRLNNFKKNFKKELYGYPEDVLFADSLVLAQQRIDEARDGIARCKNAGINTYMFVKSALTYTFVKQHIEDIVAMQNNEQEMDK